MKPSDEGAGSQTVRPFDHNFEEGGWSRHKNVLIRAVMKELTANAFKVLCAIEDASYSWGKQWAELAYSDLRDVTGIKSDRTVCEAVKELLSKGYIRRRELKPGKGFLKASYAYQTNSQLEVQITTAEIVEEVEDTTAKTIEDTTAEIVEAPLQKLQITSKTSINDIKDTPSPKKDGEHRRIRSAYLSRLADPGGYSKKGKFKADMRALKEMLADGYSGDEILACYDDKKADPFWQDKHLSLIKVQVDIAEWKRAKAEGKTEHGPRQRTIGGNSEISDEIWQRDYAHLVQRPAEA